jgi:hypothetical protein
MLWSAEDMRVRRMVGTCPSTTHCVSLSYQVPACQVATLTNPQPPSPPLSLSLTSPIWTFCVQASGVGTE